MRKGVDYIGVSVGILLFNEKSEILLTKRTNKTRNEHGKWEAPGGGVEFGETREEAIKRELKEEVGVNAYNLKVLGVFDEILPEYKQHWVQTGFIGQIEKGQIPQNLEPEKFTGIGWFPLTNLPKPLSFITLENIKQFKKLKIAKKF